MPDISKHFEPDKEIVVFHGNCINLLEQIPGDSIKLIVTSPPYNIGKEYEKRLSIDHYLQDQALIIEKCIRVLSPQGSICWQVGNYIEKGSVIPLDAILYPIFADHNLIMRNRIIWHYEHGLHCSNRFSGRYETILWFTKTNDYTFNLDPIRVPQKYPGKKYFRGKRAGEYSGNPLGKNPGNIWHVPNVKSNHVEKTEHPCQYPVELIERLVLSMTNEGDWVLDPFLGAGTSVVAAIRHSRRGAGAETVKKYIDISHDRIRQELNGTLRTRPMTRPQYDPKQSGKKLTTSPWISGNNSDQLDLLKENRTTDEK
ncbi:MAG: site-specific DNA-methyltransferase [Calditrichaeota bacterium]|jgi:adenine-specific DNA-methyltransferase|nr:site-specific DNA-methyltransferase [Calditrichota bacterium]MBT7789254.1 site-specific DNA-methyltransferase [Calditrichota bacterium]